MGTEINGIQHGANTFAYKSFCFRGRNFFSLYTFLVVFLDCRLNTFRKTEKKSSVLRTGIRNHNINSALWITTPIYNYYKHLEIITTNSEVLHPLMSYYIQLNEKNWTTIQNVKHVRSSSTDCLGPAYDVTAVRVGACISRTTSRSTVWQNARFLSFSTPNCTVSSDRNCSLRYETGKLLTKICVLLEDQPENSYAKIDTNQERTR